MSSGLGEGLSEILGEMFSLFRDSQSVTPCPLAIYEKLICFDSGEWEAQVENPSTSYRIGKPRNSKTSPAYKTEIPRNAPSDTPRKLTK